MKSLRRKLVLAFALALPSSWTIAVAHAGDPGAPAEGPDAAQIAPPLPKPPPPPPKPEPKPAPPPPTPPKPPKPAPPAPPPPPEPDKDKEKNQHVQDRVTPEAGRFGWISAL